MASALRAVLDTNVVLAAKRSKHPLSPNTEILDRWQSREFHFLFSLDTLPEYAEKLLERGIPAEEVVDFLRLVARHGELVTVMFFHFRHYPVDADDVMFLLCALNGNATHLVSYDDHLLGLRSFYLTELSICRPLDFLRDGRKS